MLIELNVNVVFSFFICKGNLLFLSFLLALLLLFLLKYINGLINYFLLKLYSSLIFRDKQFVSSMAVLKIKEMVLYTLPSNVVCVHSSYC